MISLTLRAQFTCVKIAGGPENTPDVLNGAKVS